MSKTTNKFSSEVRARAVQILLDQDGQHTSSWTAASAFSTKIGYPAHTLLGWVKRAGSFSADASQGITSVGLQADTQACRQGVQCRHPALPGWPRTGRAPAPPAPAAPET